MIVALRLVIRLFAHLREIVGKKTIELNFPSSISLISVLELLIADFPKLKEIIFLDNDFTPEIIIALNGNQIPPVEFNKTILHDGDELVFLPPFGGGSY